MDKFEYHINIEFILFDYFFFIILSYIIILLYYITIYDNII